MGDFDFLSDPRPSGHSVSRKPLGPDAGKQRPTNLLGWGFLLILIVTCIAIISNRSGNRGPADKGGQPAGEAAKDDPSKPLTTKKTAGMDNDVPNVIEQTPTVSPEQPTMAMPKGRKANAHLRIGIGRPCIGPVQIRDAIRGTLSDSAEDYLAIPVTVFNKSDVRKLEYQGSASNIFITHATVTDDLGNKYRAIDFGLIDKVAGQQKDVSLYPGESAADLYVFERPVDKAKNLTLRIDGQALGQDQPFQVRFSTPKPGADVEPPAVLKFDP